MHTVLDDHSRVAYAEIHDDETAATATAVLRRAVAWFADREVTVARVLSDNGSAYRSHLWPASAPKPSRPGPGRPPGSRNQHPAISHDVGKTAKRDHTITARRQRAG